MEAWALLVNFRKGIQSLSEQPLVGEEHCVTTLIKAAKETMRRTDLFYLSSMEVSYALPW